MNKEKFKEYVKESLPLIEQMQELKKKYGIPGTIHLRVCEDGYMCLESYDLNYEINIFSDGRIKLRIEEEL